MAETSIEWTDRSVNPIRAKRKNVKGSTGGYNSGIGHYCERISPGCAHCYASSMQPRFGVPEFGGAKKTLPVIGRNGCVSVSEDIEVFFDVDRLKEVCNRRKPSKWFWCDMTDIFGSWVPDEWIDECFRTMIRSQHHTHQVLTKRPERLREYVWKRWGDEIASNIWLGTSVEDRKHGLPRIDILRNTPAAIRFLSIEPLIEDLSTIDLTGIHWVIVGGESGRGARPFKWRWAESLLRQCRLYGTKFFMKQAGKTLDEYIYRCTKCGHIDTDDGFDILGADGVNLFCNQCNHEDDHSFTPVDPKGADPAEWPEDMRVREFPK